MNQSVAIKPLIVAMSVTALIVSPEFCYWVVHSIVVGLFELLEGILDAIIEDLFHTDRHTTQLIVFYLMWGMFFCFVYILQRYIKKWIRQAVTAIPQWQLNHWRVIDKWSEQPLNKKIRVISGCFLGTLCFAFLL